MQKFWRAIVNFFVETLSEQPALVPIRSTARSAAHLQLQRRLQRLHRR